MYICSIKRPFWLNAPSNKRRGTQSEECGVYSRIIRRNSDIETFNIFLFYIVFTNIFFKKAEMNRVISHFFKGAESRQSSSLCLIC